MTMALEQRMEQGAETTRSRISRSGPPHSQLHTDTLRTITLGQQGLELKRYVSLRDQWLHEPPVRFLSSHPFSLLDKALHTQIPLVVRQSHSSSQALWQGLSQNRLKMFILQFPANRSFGELVCFQTLRHQLSRAANTSPNICFPRKGDLLERK